MRDEKESRETMDTGYSKWRKLDNAALAFPLVTGKDDTRVFRFYCQLKEKVTGKSCKAHWIRQWKNIRCFRQF